MRILFLNHNVVWVSTFLRCFQFAKGLVKSGHQVTIATNDPSSRWSFKCYSREGVEIIQSPDLLWGQLRTGWDPVNVVRRIWFLKNRKFDLIHAFDCRPTVILPALYLKRRLKIPLVIDWADWWGRGGAISQRQPRWLNKIFEPIETLFEENFRRYAAITTVASQLLETRVKKLIGPEANIILLPNGSDTDSFRPIGKSVARKKLGFSRQKYLAIFSGYVIYDIKLVIESIRLLVNDGFPLTLIITGSTSKIIYRLASDLITAENIILAGKVDFQLLPYFLAAADVALMPLSDNIANRARYPMKFGDYLAAGIPIVTNYVGVGQTVRKQKLGLACRFNPKSYAQGIKTILTDKRLQKIYSENCLRFASGEHNFMRRVGLLEKIYTNVKT